ncbi:MAG: 23S rRNA (pseudouridine(1915)-N(3))-methyltransferase RlmH [Rikenellaceae bacterium]
MNIEFIVVGKTDLKQVSELVEMYAKRINFYLKFNITTLPDLKNTKNLSVEQQKTQEGVMLLKNFNDSDFVVLMDENGREFSSVKFADYLEKKMLASTKRLCFVIGGPYGFSPEVYARANDKISLSKMTFSHQIVRALFCEQLYRALTIIKGEPYHHQ